MASNNYTQSDFNDDAMVTARTLHAAYNRCKVLRQRWVSTFSAIETDPARQLLMEFVNEYVAMCEASGAPYSVLKLDLVLAMSDLKLPGDGE